MDPLNLGIDLGRSEARLYDGETLYTLPLLLGAEVETIRRGSARVLDEALEQHLTVKVGRQIYSVGKNALEQPFIFPLADVDPFAEPLNLIPFYALIALYMRRRGLNGIPRFKLCFGLPVAVSRRTDYAQARMAEFVKLHSFEFCGAQVSFDVVQVDALPAPVGVVYAAILSGHLDFKAGENVGVIDAGHMTTDWAVVRHPHELAQYSGQTTAAAGIRLTEAISKALLEEGISRPNPLAVLEAISSGTYVDKGESLPLPEGLIEDRLSLMAQQIALTVKQTWRDITVDKIFLSGGFGRILYPHLTQFPHLKDAQLIEDPRYANVKGAYEYAIATPYKEATATLSRVAPAMASVPELAEAEA